MRRGRGNNWRRALPLASVAVAGVLIARGMVFYHGSKDPMQVVLGIVLTFGAVIFCALGLLTVADIAAKRRGRHARPTKR